MTDVLSPEQRRLNMSRIRAKDTGPEQLVRRALYARGLRYRLHVRTLPGTPDLVFSRHKAVVFVNGCFWHAHQGCPLFRLPGTRTDFWRDKLQKNIERDRQAVNALVTAGWRVCTIWECALKGPGKLPSDEVARIAHEFLVCNDAKHPVLSLPCIPAERPCEAEEIKG